MSDRGITLMDVSRQADGTVAIGSARTAQQGQARDLASRPRRRRGIP
jgi:hypothetical protein